MYVSSPRLPQLKTDTASSSKFFISFSFNSETQSIEYVSQFNDLFLVRDPLVGRSANSAIPT